jgi:hypothetical protein
MLFLSYILLHVVNLNDLCYLEVITTRPGRMIDLTGNVYIALILYLCAYIDKVSEKSFDSPTLRQS